MDLQERITHGWQVSAEGFSRRVVAKDFEMPGREVWTRAVLKLAPREGALDILDVGTGPGLFATILAMAGHRTIGIDISENMLMEARKNSRRMGVEPEYFLMNSQELTFPDHSFDLIVSRNVVWTIKEPELAYKSWLRCLKPGGRVIVFDANHDRDMENSAGREQKYEERFGEKPPVSYTDYEEARGFRRELKLRDVNRPEWDIAVMERLGYENIGWENVSEEVSYDEKNRILYEGKQFVRLYGDKSYSCQ